MSVRWYTVVIDCQDVAAQARWWAEVLGYYAMPLLWRDRVIGWANCAGAGSDVEVGYVDRAPTGGTYAKALDAEIERLRSFLIPA